MNYENKKKKKTLYEILRKDIYIFSYYDIYIYVILHFSNFFFLLSLQACLISEIILG